MEEQFGVVGSQYTCIRMVDDGDGTIDWSQTWINFNVRQEVST